MANKKTKSPKVTPGSSTVTPEEQARYEALLSRIDKENPAAIPQDKKEKKTVDAKQLDRFRDAISNLRRDLRDSKKLPKNNSEDIHFSDRVLLFDRQTRKKAVSIEFLSDYILEHEVEKQKVSEATFHVIPTNNQPTANTQPDIPKQRLVSVPYKPTKKKSEKSLGKELFDTMFPLLSGIVGMFDKYSDKDSKSKISKDKKEEKSAERVDKDVVDTDKLLKVSLDHHEKTTKLLEDLLDKIKGSAGSHGSKSSGGLWNSMPSDVKLALGAAAVAATVVAVQAVVKHEENNKKEQRVDNSSITNNTSSISNISAPIQEQSQLPDISTSSISAPTQQTDSLSKNNDNNLNISAKQIVFDADSFEFNNKNNIPKNSSSGAGGLNQQSINSVDDTQSIDPTSTIQVTNQNNQVNNVSIQKLSELLSNVNQVSSSDTGGMVDSSVSQQQTNTGTLATPTKSTSPVTGSSLNVKSTAAVVSQQKAKTPVVNVVPSAPTVKSSNPTMGINQAPIDPDEPGNVEPPDALTRYQKLFNLTAA